MRRTSLLALLPLGLTLAMPAAAQHWNDSGPGRDLLSSTVGEFDSFRQRAPAAQPSFSPAGAGVAAQTQARAPIPILDWVPPPPVPAATTPRRRTSSAPVRRAPAPPAMQDPVVRDTRPVSAPLPTGGSDVERSLAERERELDRLRRILEDDRLRYQQRSQPQLR